MLNAEQAQEQYPNIPWVTLENLVAYVECGRPCGNFLTAVLSNDLFEAVRQADNKNQDALVDIVKLIYNEAPMKAHGNAEKVSEWSEKRGMEQWNTKAA